jgi:hypothetical protein
MSFNPFTTPFACTLNQQSVFARYPNPDFIVRAFTDVVTEERLFCRDSIQLEGIPGIRIEFDPNGIPPSPKNPKKHKDDSSDDDSSDDDSSDDMSFRFMRISSIPLPFEDYYIKAERFARFYEDTRFIAYLKAIIAKALIDHFLVNRMTRASIMTTKFVITFVNYYYERSSRDFKVHMDVFKEPEIHLDKFSLTFLVPHDVVIRGTTIMAAGKHSPKQSVSVPIVNGMSLLIKQFHDKGELFWHSTPQHDSSAGERDYIGNYKFQELPISTSSIPRETMTTIHANTASLEFRQLIRNAYLTIDPATIEKSIKYQSNKRFKFSQKYSQIKNKYLSALTFDKAWLNEIIAFVEWVTATMPPPFGCPDETHESVDKMVSAVGEMLGVGGHNKHRNNRRNKRSNKRRNKRSNKRRNKRSNKRRNKRSNKRRNKRTKSKRSYKRRK